MRERRQSADKSLAGSLLLAHPVMRDPNFRRTVILMTSDNAEGSMGFILNRPTNQRLGELGGDFALGPLAGVPVFKGGPVQTGQMILAAWTRQPHGFNLHLGIDPEKAGAFLGESGAHVRAFFGYAGWSPGQLREELKLHTWVVSNPPDDLFAHESDTRLWSKVLGQKGAEWRLLAEEPEDPESN